MPSAKQPGLDEQPLAFPRAQRVKAGLTDATARQVRADCRFFAEKVLGVSGDPWQTKFWGAVSGPHVDPSAKNLLALMACKGPGKTFGIAVVGWWWLFTRWHANGAAISITGDNLRDNLWAELARVQGRAQVLGNFFSHRGERIEAKKFEKDWWLSFRTFPQNADKTQQAATLAGLHGRHPIVLCDETGDYPDGVVVAAEAVLSTLVDGQPPDGRVIVVGNLTNRDGPLGRIAGRDRPRWWVCKITSDPEDPDRSTRVDPAWVQAQIDLWGRDSDFVRVNILGEFPRQQADKLLGVEAVMEASQREPREGYEVEPVIFGLDVARFGDDASVLFQRQGTMTWKPLVWREVSTMALADRVATEFVAKNPAALFVDQAGAGGGVIDRLRQLGIPTLAVDFGGSALDSRFFDRRSEMYWKLSDWFKRGGSIPDDPQLRTELLAPTFKYHESGKISRLKLESKSEMRKRGLKSPDMADALALTFAAPVVGPAPQGAQYEVPVAARDGWQGRLVGGTEETWDPFAGG